MPTERELKYSMSSERVPDADELRGVLRPLGYSVAPKGTVRQRNVYYDSPGGTLDRARVALRVRDESALGGGGLTRLAALKGKGRLVDGAFERLEVEAPLGLGGPPPWPPAVVAALAAELGMTERGPLVDELVATLQPRVVIETVRERFVLAGAAGDVAELVFDDVTSSPPEALAHEFAIQEVGFREVEIEALKDDAGALASVDALLEVGEALSSLAALSVSSVTKLERSLALLAPFARE